jgi:tetratricopeptide (TPR) repeat protein
MVAVLAVLACVPRTAFAGPEEPLPGIADEPAPPATGGNDEMLDRAMAAYERGQQNYKLAQYNAALADFKEASSLYASPDFQYNIGLCYEKLGQYDEAVLAYVTYLKVKPEAEDRANVEATIQRLQTLSRDQKDRAADDDRDSPIIAPGPAPTPVDEPARPKPWKPLVIAGAVIAGVGATVALGGGIAFGVLAKSRSDDLDAVQNGGNPDGLSFSDAEALESDGKRFETLQIGMAAGGAAVAVVGGALLAVGLVRKSKQGTGATARLVPQLGSHTAGVALVGRF